MKYKIFLFSLWLLPISLIILISLEYSGTSKKILNSLTEEKVENSIIKTDYYGFNLNKSPHSTEKEIDPYYFFIYKKINQDKNLGIINIDKFGFRLNPENNFKNNGILLGGSTAFGYLSSNDSNTIAANLSKMTNLNFFNLNSLSWNSHQELIAQLKYNENYKVSLSLSFSNDFEISCRETFGNKKYKYIDTIESFNVLKNIVENNKKIKISNLKEIIKKNFIQKYFNDSYYLFNTIKYIRRADSHKEKTNKEIFHYCNDPYNNDIKTIVDQFLLNQNKMLMISKARNAKHITILQPIRNFYIKNEKNYLNSKKK